MKKNFYSHDNPETAEGFFHVFEQGLKEEIQAALSVSVSEPSRKRDLLGGLLLSQALTAFVWNPVHVNERLDDQFDAILQAGEQLRRRLLLGWNERESSHNFLVRATGMDQRWIPPDEREESAICTDRRRPLGVDRASYVDGELPSYVGHSCAGIANALGRSRMGLASYVHRPIRCDNPR